jgi:cysteine desulfurase / selenocysteine lyase
MSVVADSLLARPPFDLEQVRSDFPILRQTVRGRRLVYLDNAATSQKPRQVIDRLVRYYTEENSNVHRGVHMLSERATEAYEAARKTMQRFVNASSEREIIFVRGCTEAVNLVARTFGRVNVGEGDEVVISAMEHHSNIVPWQMLCEEKKAKLRVIPINQRGEIELDSYQSTLSERTKIVAIVHVSNSLGTINPLREMIAIAHARGIPVFVDGAQAAPHMKIDVQELDADFYALSGHKMFGPTGIGVLYGKERFLEAMPPFLGGGDMIRTVTFEKTTYNTLPYKFEAGTPNIADAIGLASAAEYVESIGHEKISVYEAELLRYASGRIESLRDARLIGTAKQKASVLSFVLGEIHPHDIGTIVDQEGVAIRTGHHCTQPVMAFFDVPATARASFAFYNTKEDVDALIEALEKVYEVFG